MHSNIRMQPGKKQLRRAVLGAACALALLPGQAKATNPPPPPPALTVTVTPGQATPNPATVGKQMIASLSATPNNAPETTKEVTVTGPNWQWSPSVTVMESGDGTNFSPAPASDYSASVSGGGSSSSATFNFTPKVAACFTAQVSVTVTYQEYTTDNPPKPLSPVSASGSAYVLGIGPASGGSGSGSGASAQAVSVQPAATGMASSPETGNLLVGAGLHIFYNGSDASGQTETVWVGQGVQLSVEEVPDLEAIIYNKTGMSDNGSEYTWSTGSGEAVGGYYSDTSTAYPISLTNPVTGKISGSSLHLYWVGGYNGAMGNANISVTDSNFSSMGPGKLNFQLESPSASMSAVTRPTTVDPNFSLASGMWSIHNGNVATDQNGNDTFQADGITWTFQANNYQGGYELIQMVTSKSMIRYTTAGTSQSGSWQSGSGASFPALDTYLPYPGTNGISDGAMDADSPSVKLFSSYHKYNVSESFEDYLMFSPSITSDSIFVPIGSMTWSYGGTAVQQTDGTWMGSGLSPTSNGKPSYSPSGPNPVFPTYSGNISHFDFPNG